MLEVQSEKHSEKSEQLDFWLLDIHNVFTTFFCKMNVFFMQRCKPARWIILNF